MRANGIVCDTIVMSVRSLVRALAAFFACTRAGAYAHSFPSAAVFVTYLDHVGDLACASVRSAAASRIQLAIVGLGGPASGAESDPKRRKVAAVREFLLASPAFANDTHIVFSDGTDVLYTHATRSFMARMAIGLGVTAPRRVIFGAERNCWPFMDGERELQPGGRVFCSNIARASASSFRFPNAGNWIARKDVAIRMLSDWMAHMTAHPDNDDQHALLQLFAHADELPYELSIDSTCTMFQTGWGTPLERGGWNVASPNPGPFLEKHPNGCVVNNTETRSAPPIVHFNGGKHEFLRVTAHCRERVPHRIAEWYARTYPSLQAPCVS